MAERLELLKLRQSELLTAHPTASAPASQPEAGAERPPAHRLYAVLDLYENELNRWQATGAQIEKLKAESFIEAMGREMQGWKDQQAHYAEIQGDHLRHTPPAHLEEIEAEYTQWENLLTDLTAQQAAREQQLDALRKIRAENEAATAQSLEQLRAFVAELPSRIERVEAAADRDALLLAKRALEWEHNLELLRGSALVASRTLLGLQQEQDAERIDALADYVQTLREYRNRLEKARSQSMVELASEQLNRTDLPAWMLNYWRIVLVATEGSRFFQELDDPTLGRFPPSVHERLEARITRARAYWENFMESMDRRPGTAILSGYRRIGEGLQADRDLLRELRYKLDQTIEEQRSATDRQGYLLDEIDSLRERFDQQLRSLEGDELIEARKLQAQLTSEVQAALDERIQAVTSEQEALRERLRNTVVLLNEHVERLSRYRSGMYWSHLLVPNYSLSPKSWAAAREELVSLRAGQGAQAEQWREYWKQVRDGFSSPSALPWATGLVLFVGSAVTGYQVRRRLFTEPGGGADAVAELASPARLQIGLRHMAATLACWALPLVVVLIVAGIALGWRSASFTVVAVPIGSVLAALVALTIVGANFTAARPWSRLVPCSDRAAAYHRRGLTVIVLLALAVLPVPVFLGYTGLLPQTYTSIKAAGMLFLLTALLIYLLRRDMFVGTVAGWSRDNPNRLARYFWILPLLVVGLAVLELAGYDALATYLVGGVFWSVVVTWIALSVLIPLRARTREAERKLDQALSASDSVDVALDPKTIHPLVLIGQQVLKAAIVIAALVAALYGWGISPVEIRILLDAPLFSIGDRPVQLWRVIAAIFAMGAGFLASRGLQAFLQTQVFPRSRINRGAQAASCTLLHYSIIGLGIYAALMLLNLRLGALAVLLGTLGLGLGLGLQPVFVNFISGLLILFERQIKVGDIIEVGDQLGEVTAVSMRSTKIRTFDNVELDIPNGEFVTSKVVNWTMPDSKMRGKLDVGVSYEADPQLVRRLLLEIADRHPLVLRDPPPAVWFTNFGDNSLDFTLACWFATPAHRAEFLMQIRYEVLRLFREHDIEIPYPQRTLSAGGKPIPVELVVRDGDVPATVSRPARTPPRSDPSQQ